MQIETIKAALWKLNLKRVSADTGIHHNTLLAIRNNPHANPTLRTMTTLADYIRALAGGMADD